MSDFESWFKKWTDSSSDWDDAAGNYRCIAEEAWDYQQARIEELEVELEKLRGAASSVVEDWEATPHDESVSYHTMLELAALLQEAGE